jgi:glucokinase
MRIGIDIGGTNTALGIVDERNTVRYRASRPTQSAGGETQVVGVIAALVRDAQAVAAGHGWALESLGVGVPGDVDRERGLVREAANLGWHDVALVQLLSQETGFDVAAIALENDANCFALGEYAAGEARGASDSVTITLGTGIGSGIIVGGRLVEHTEAGHMVTHAGGRACACGKHGCWERYASASALIANANEAYEVQCGGVGKGAQPAVSSAKEVFDAARAGSAAAQELVEAYTYELGVGLANLIELLAPQVIVINGGVAHESDLFLPAAARVACDHAVVDVDAVRICASQLMDDAGLIGAAGV